MKLILTTIVLLITSLATQAQSVFDNADSFFAKNVKNGKVNYAGIKKQPQELNTLVKQIAEHDLSNKRVTDDYIKAFYINAYNVLVIKQVVDRYPIEGPMKVKGFFDGIKHTVMGEEMTMNQLEKGLLYTRYPDPRLHFVLVCAAKGCPPLADCAYQPEDLNEQLTKRTNEVLNLDWFIHVRDSKVYLSQIFSWYKGDFEDGSLSLISYINQYKTDKIPSKSKISFYEYDWSLNE